MPSRLPPIKKRTHLDNVNPLTDAQRVEVERQAFNFHRDHGRPVLIGEDFYDALKAAGVNMKHMEKIKPNA